ncbi:MAG: hypothetical protein HKN16_06490, partial [Saprospiraceae bacterium]|nr:hypothetical protein [Saprospiraceae bacterium]
MDVISNYFPDFKVGDLVEESIRRELGNGLPLAKAELSLRLTYLQRLTLEFLATEEARKDPAQTRIMQLRALRGKEQFKLYEKLEKKSIENDESPTFDSRYYYQAYQRFEEADQFQNQKAQYNKPELIIEKQKMLNAFFLSEKIKDACELIQRARVLKKEDFERLDDFGMKEIQKNSEAYDQYPPLALYNAIYQMLLIDNVETFANANSVLQNYKQNLSKPDLVNGFNFLLNFCIKKVNEGDRSWLSTSFSLYKQMLENGLLEIDGILPEWHYKNLATNGLLLKETNWVFNFIHDYKGSLNPEIAENAFAYNLAALYHQRGEYEKVLPLLLQVEYKDWRYSLNAKVLLLKTYYDMDEEEALL